MTEPVGTVLSVAAARALDRWAIEALGLPGLVLMENAGAAAARAAWRLAGERQGEVWVLAGSGNNAGDGWVVARHARCDGRAVRVLCTVSPPDLNGDAAVMARAAAALGVEWERVESRERWSALAARSRDACSVVVDALLGTGAKGAPRAAIASAIEAFEALRNDPDAPRAPVLALDVPSGMNADATGAKCGGGVLTADHTIAFAALKPALLDPSQARWIGALEVASIGVPVPGS
ncbi:MAG: NAD(P)H-hydrate epimerase [Planctomycetota bacterium]